MEGLGRGRPSRLRAGETWRLGAIARTIGALVLLVLASTGAALAAPQDAWLGKVASLQNQVETKRSSEAGWAPTTLRQSLFEHDRVRTGPASRATILYSDQMLHRLNEKSEVELVAPSAGSPGLLRILSGDHYFSSRTPRDYGRIETPTVTAAIKGTEFVVSIAPDTTTKITMLEGVVEASNGFGTLRVGRGEEALVEPGKAPVKRIVVKPRDAVAWALDYPAVLGGSDAARLKSMGAEGSDLARAADLLSSGQVLEARPLIEGVRARRPDDAVALALSSVIEVTANHKEEAMRLAERAVAADSRSASAALALSFAAQASFDIERARRMAEKAADLDSESSVALARVSELRMAEGDIAGASEAAQRAVSRTPNQPRALAVLGFARLAELRSEEAESQFEKAVSADPSFALARLGLGISRIRRGRLAAGREELQTATALDPDDSLLRSYLAKAYYEEKRSVEAGKELEAAKELDPNDPTPYLYDAIRKQNENRPIEALDDLRQSIERNDRRAVYRSRLLLDQDRAVRSSDLARIYNDVGFEQLGLVTARRSADEDQANYSSHLFLAGNYRGVPGFAPAFLSEVLQSRIYQPVSVNAVRPDVVNESVSFNEYTALFERPRLRAFGGFSYGEVNNDLSELSPHNHAQSSFVSLSNPDINGGQAVGSWNADRFSAAVGVSHSSDDGFRINSDRTITNYRGFFEFAPTASDSFQLNALYGRQESGDLPIRGFVAQLTPERFRTRLTNVGLGYHRILSPAADFVVSVIYNETRQTALGLDPFTTRDATGILRGPQIELQQVWRRKALTWIFGAGGFDGKVRLESTGLRLESNDTFLNGYAYAKLRDLGPFEVTLGGAVEHVASPSGLIVPRDSLVSPAEVDFTETRFSPKASVAWYAGAKTTLRAAAYYRLAPAVGRVQTLEPTQVGGFNQFFGDPGGTRSLSYGGGIDQELGRHIFGGISVLGRRLTIPEATCTNPNRFSACRVAVPGPTVIVSRDGRDVLGAAYLDATVTKRVALGIDYSYSLRKFDSFMVDNLGPFEDRIETDRVRPQVRVILPFGLFAAVSATYYDQSVDEFEDLGSSARDVVHARFWIGDVDLGYRLPRRYGTILLSGRNVTDREFEFFERSVEDTVTPARSVTLTANFTF